MKVAIFGGSFSPVHKGHLSVASGVLSQGLADEVWLMPCRRNPLKTDASLWPDETRLRLLRDAMGYWEKLKKEKRIKITEIELGMPSPSYTYNTVKALMDKYPENEFRLLVGADSYLSFRDWYEWEWLENNLDPIVYPRPGYEIKDPLPGWTLLEGVEKIDISSTEIRKRIARKLPVQDIMPWYNT